MNTFALLYMQHRMRINQNINICHLLRGTITCDHLYHSGGMHSVEIKRAKNYSSMKTMKEKNCIFIHKTYFEQKEGAFCVIKVYGYMAYAFCVCLCVDGDAKSRSHCDHIIFIHSHNKKAYRNDLYCSRSE